MSLSDCAAVNERLCCRFKTCQSSKIGDKGSSHIIAVNLNYTSEKYILISYIDNAYFTSKHIS